jgi:hypothetical protein
VPQVDLTRSVLKWFRTIGISYVREAIPTQAIYQPSRIGRGGNIVGTAAVIPGEAELRMPPPYNGILLCMTNYGLYLHIPTGFGAAIVILMLMGSAQIPDYVTALCREMEGLIVPWAVSSGAHDLFGGGTFAGPRCSMSLVKAIDAASVDQN